MFVIIKTTSMEPFAADLVQYGRVLSSDNQQHLVDNYTAVQTHAQVTEYPNMILINAGNHKLCD